MWKVQDELDFHFVVGFKGFPLQEGFQTPTLLFGISTWGGV